MTASIATAAKLASIAVVTRPYTATQFTSFNSFSDQQLPHTLFHSYVHHSRIVWVTNGINAASMMHGASDNKPTRNHTGRSISTVKNSTMGLAS